MSNKPLGFFEQQALLKKLEKLLINLPHAGGYSGFRKDSNNPKFRKSYEAYLAGAEQCGFDTLLRVAEVLDALPRNWLEKPPQDDRELKLRCLVELGLSHLTDEDRLPILLGKLESMGWRLAVGVLERMEIPSIPDALIRLLVSGSLKSQEIASDVITGRNGQSQISVTIDSETLQKLINNLTHEKANVRRATIIVLGWSNQSQVVDSVTRQLGDANSAVRLAAAQVLQKFNWGPHGDHARMQFLLANRQWDELASFGAEVIPLLTEVLDDEDLKTRKEVITTLGKTRNEKAIQPLLKILDTQSARDHYEECKARAILALGEIGDTQVVDKLIDMMNKYSARNVKEAAARALGMIGDTRALPALVQLLTGNIIYDTQPNSYVITNSPQRIAAAEALGRIGDVRAIASLLKMGQDTRIDPDVRIAAVRALARVGDASVIPQLERLKSEKYKSIREAAVESIQQIAKREPESAGESSFAADGAGSRTEMPPLSAVRAQLLGMILAHASKSAQALAEHQRSAVKPQQAILTNAQKKTDLIPGTISAETLGGVASPVIVKGTALPAEAGQTFFTAFDNQSRMEIHLVFGENPMVVNNLSLGRFSIDGIPAAPRGHMQIEVRFHVDPALNLSVTAQARQSSYSKSFGPIKLPQEIPASPQAHPQQALPKPASTLESSSRRPMEQSTGSSSISHPYFNNFSQEAREAASYSAELIYQYGHNQIDVEHLLLAMLKQLQGSVHQILHLLKIAPSALIEQLEVALRASPKSNIFGARSGMVFMTPRVKRVIDLALQEASHLKAERISAEHLLLAILTEKNTPAVRILEAAGLTRERGYWAMQQRREQQRISETARFDRFTEGAQLTAQHAAEVARRYGHNQIDTEHFLLALIEKSLETTPQILEILGANPGTLATQLDDAIRRGPKAFVPSDPAQIYITPRIVRIIDSASEEAQQLNDKLISTEHILLSIAAESNTPAARLLATAGLHRNRIYSAIQRLRTEPGHVLEHSEKENSQGSLNCPECSTTLRSREHYVGEGDDAAVMAYRGLKQIKLKCPKCKNIWNVSHPVGIEKDSQVDVYVGESLKGFYDQLAGPRKEVFKKQISRAHPVSEMKVNLGKIPDEVTKEIEKMAQQWLKELQVIKQSVVGSERLQSGRVILYIIGGFEYKEIQQLKSLFFQYQTRVNANLPPSVEPMDLSIESGPSNRHRIS
jgi:HEAT repeat protein